MSSGSSHRDRCKEAERTQQLNQHSDTYDIFFPPISSTFIFHFNISRNNFCNRKSKRSLDIFSRMFIGRNFNSFVLTLSIHFHSVYDDVITNNETKQLFLILFFVFYCHITGCLGLLIFFLANISSTALQT